MLCDWGFAAALPRDGSRTYTILGTPEYLSPECVLGQGYRFDVDLWALGILTYEMLRGRSPFAAPDPDDTMAVFRNVTAAKLRISSRVAPDAGDFVAALLRRHRADRLGDAAAVKRHAVFAGLDWAALRAKRLPAPYVPSLAGPTDASRFDVYDEDSAKAPFDGDQAPFAAFSSGFVEDPV